MFLQYNSKLNNMSKRNNIVFKALHIVTWVIFVGLCIEAGGLIVNFIYSLFKPEIVHQLYQKLDLSQIYNLSKWAYSRLLRICPSLLKAAGADLQSAPLGCGYVIHLIPSALAIASFCISR